MAKLSPAAEPSIASLAQHILGMEASRLPTDGELLKSAVVAEAIRTALYTMCSKGGSVEPIHNLQLRGWIAHKLGALVPDLFEPDGGGYRDVLVEGRCGSLEFLGDALLLADGFVCPAPTRFVEIGSDAHLLVSGEPTRFLPDYRDRVVHTGLGRRVEGMSSSEAHALGVRRQSLEDYLAPPTALLVVDKLLSRIIEVAPAPWIGAPDWEVYVGNKEPSAKSPGGRYGFIWVAEADPSAEKAPRFPIGGKTFTLRRRLISTSERYYSYYFRTESTRPLMSYEVEPQRWKQACLAIDFVTGKQRQATVARGASASEVSLSLGFPPFESLAKALFVLGARLSPVKRGYSTWIMPDSGSDRVRGILERSGVAVRTIGAGA